MLPQPHDLLVLEHYMAPLVAAAVKQSSIENVVWTHRNGGALKIRHCMVILSRVEGPTSTYGVLVTIIDTTDKVLAMKQTQHALEMAEGSSAEWQAIFQAASQGLAVIDEHLDIIAMNRAAAEILGFSEDEVGNKNETRLGKTVLRHHPTGEPLNHDDYPANQAARGRYVVNFPAVLENRAGRSVDVLISTAPRNALLQVLDEGRGIPADELDKVFEGFYRPSKVKDWVSGSIGLGLYISRATARAHGGDPWAENRPGGGTTMCLRLPLLSEVQT